MLQLHQAPHHLLSLHQQVYQLLKIRALRKGLLRWATSNFSILDYIYLKKLIIFITWKLKNKQSRLKKKVNIKNVIILILYF